jgi:hypothetical protein
LALGVFRESADVATAPITVQWCTENCAVRFTLDSRKYSIKLKKLGFSEAHRWHGLCFPHGNFPVCRSKEGAAFQEEAASLCPTQEKESPTRVPQ